MTTHLEHLVRALPRQRRNAIQQRTIGAGQAFTGVLFCAGMSYWLVAPNRPSGFALWCILLGLFAAMYMLLGGCYRYAKADFFVNDLDAQIAAVHSALLDQASAGHLALSPSVNAFIDEAERALKGLR